MLQCFVNQNAHVYIEQKTWQFSLLKVMKIPTQKGEHSWKCSVVPITKRVNYKWHFFVILHFLPYRGTYILQPKAFISTGFVLSGPKLKIVVQPDPSRPSSLNVEYDTKYTLIVGQSMPGTRYMYILFKGRLFAQKTKIWIFTCTLL